MKEISYSIAATSQGFMENIAAALEEVSPMVLHSTYQAATMFVRVNRDSPHESSIEALQILKLALRTKDKRWKAGGTF